MLEKAQTISDKLILSEESLSSNSASLKWQEERMSLEIFFLNADATILSFLPSLWLQAWPVFLICNKAHVSNS